MRHSYTHGTPERDCPSLNLPGEHPREQTARLTLEIISAKEKIKTSRWFDGRGSFAKKREKKKEQHGG